MPAKIRLARHGRKKTAYYQIVVADRRAPRDGRFIEKIGIYNPMTNPATIELDFNKALNWLENGAQPTETVRAILSYKGVLLKKHLLEGVRKGAFNEAEAEKRFEAWKTGKDEKIQAKIERLAKAEVDDHSMRLEAEVKVNEARAAEILRKNSKLAEAEAKAAAGEEAVVEEAVVEEVVVEEAVVEEAVVEEAVVEEVKAEEEQKPADEVVAIEKAEAGEPQVNEEEEGGDPEAEKQGEDAAAQAEEGKEPEENSEEEKKS